MNKRIKKSFIIILFLFIVVFLTFVGLNVVSHALYPLKYEEYVDSYSQDYNVPDDLVFAVIKSESSFDPAAVSSIGAIGLMQITEDTFNWAKWRMGDTNTIYDDLFDAETNIKYGTFILSLLLAEFKTPETALAAYHAGWGSAKKWLADNNHSIDGETIYSIPFKDTAAYVPKVIKTCSIYHKLYPDKFN